MTQAESDLLRRMVENGGGVYAREVVQDDARTMRLLVQRGYVVRAGALEAAVYRVTDAGRVALADFQQARDDEVQRRADENAKEKREWLQAEDRAARDRRFSLWSALLGAAVGGIVTFLLDHLADVGSILRRVLGL